MVDDDGDSDDGTLVIFSLSVLSARPIDVLSPFRDSRPRPDGDVLYDVAHVSFSEGDGHTRADRLDREVTAALDRLDATTVDPALLGDDDTFVRAFFTFDAGAETIRADVVRRLARINATIWIDVY